MMLPPRDPETYELRASEWDDGCRDDATCAVCGKPCGQPHVHAYPRFAHRDDVWHHANHEWGSEMADFIVAGMRRQQETIMEGFCSDACAAVWAAGEITPTDADRILDTPYTTALATGAATIRDEPLPGALMDMLRSIQLAFAEMERMERGHPEGS